MTAIILFAYTAHVKFVVRKEKKLYGIPDGLILYSDLNHSAAPLFSRRFLLIGRPDYIVKKDNYSIPVEVKSGHRQYPHESQILQLAVYCQILEDISGMFVPEGILVYNNLQYIIPFDPKLRFELDTVMKTMRNSLRNGVVQRNHKDFNRCKHCSMKIYCNKVLSKNY